MRPSPDIVLRLHVRNRPGVMSHVSGLFARRAFNVEGIVCLPVGDAARSAILLLVHDDERLEQMVRELRKLEDVLDIERATTRARPSSLRSAICNDCRRYRRAEFDIWNACFLSPLVLRLQHAEMSRAIRHDR